MSQCSNTFTIRVDLIDQGLFVPQSDWHRNFVSNTIQNALSEVRKNPSRFRKLTLVFPDEWVIDLVHGKRLALSHDGRVGSWIHQALLWATLITEHGWDGAYEVKDDAKFSRLVTAPKYGVWVVGHAQYERFDWNHFNFQHIRDPEDRVPYTAVAAAATVLVAIEE